MTGKKRREKPKPPVTPKPTRPDPIPVSREVARVLELTAQVESLKARLDVERSVYEAVLRDLEDSKTERAALAARVLELEQVDAEVILEGRRSSPK